MQINIDKIYLNISEDGKPLGVFAIDDIAKNTIIEESVIIMAENPKWEDLDSGFLPFFIGIPYLRKDSLELADKHGGSSIFHVSRPVCASGFAMFYNRGNNSNISYSLTARNTVIFKTSKNVKKDEQLILLKKC